ncbi:leucine-rich repeat protein [Dysgonomonas sp. 520]|uniref:leucine-rich repeat protein n=1 Tax=Dysgonomonas sp. 520 TaxID=2302931 RepID=UPI0013D5BC5E|nr:leucine-rich repeat protein [Dysgonomonas sp. 520]NDW08581.1 T9SS C-terminal target domain-containing protein [Dysgonomonas sp. 520]
MKTSYFIKSAVVSALCLLSFQMKAQTVVDGIAYKVVDGVAETSQLPGDVKYTLATINIPANVTIDGTSYPVKIGDNSMRENNNLTSLTIADGVEVIGNSAFAQCENLPAVVLPSSIKTIDVWAFYGCKKLASINIPDGVEIITEHTFQETALTEVVLPASVTTLDVCSFQTTPLTSINLENVTIIRGWALAQTKITSVSAPKVTNVGGTAFYECFDLVTADLPNVTVVEGGIFKNCNNLVSVNMPKSTNTGAECFNGCSSLESVTMNSLKNIGDWAFANCTSLTKLTIPNTVVLVGAWALEKTGLEEVYISWDEDGLSELYLGDNFYGTEDGASDFVWKVPEELFDLYGDEWEGLPVEVGVSGIGNNQVANANAYYANGSLNLINLDGYSANVISLDGRVVSSIQVVGDNSEVAVDLASGIYLLSATKGSDKVAAKFIVK